jgi:hypothetical protein
MRRRHPSSSLHPPAATPAATVRVGVWKSVNESTAAAAPALSAVDRKFSESGGLVIADDRLGTGLPADDIRRSRTARSKKPEPVAAHGRLVRLSSQSLSSRDHARPRRATRRQRGWSMPAGRVCLMMMTAAPSPGAWPTGTGTRLLARSDAPAMRLGSAEARPGRAQASAQGQCSAVTQHGHAYM